MTSAFPFAAVLFDMDGVIIDNAALHMAVWAEFARAHGRQLTEAEIAGTTGRRSVDIIATLFGPTLTPEELTTLAQERASLYRSRADEVPARAVAGVHDFIAALKQRGVPHVLATSADKRNVARVLSDLGLEGAFDAVLSAEDVQEGKPHPDIYLKAAQRAGADPARCLVIEDALPGVRSAKAAGARCLGLTTTEPREALLAAGADWTAPSPAELPEDLRSLLFAA